MVSKFASVHSVLLVLVSCVALVTCQDECHPGVVRNLQLSGNSTLTWDPPLNENCEIQNYIVRVSILESDEQWSYTTPVTSLDVGHLTPCLRYYFQVSQVTTANITGSFASMNTVTPPPSEANLALAYLNLTPIERNVRLEWSLEDEWVQCAQRYRVVIVNEPNNIASDIYTTTPSVNVVGLMGCASYTFTVRALFTLEEEGPASVARHVAPDADTSVPTVQSVEVGSTQAILTLGLQNYERNRCPIQSINVIGPSFNATIPVTDQANRHEFRATLSNLQSDTMYYLQVSATNTAGTTRPTLLAVQTLEATN